MALIETESIILKSYNLAEADKIVVFLTREHGVIRGVAKGAKRLKSRFGSGLEPFSSARVTYFQKEVVELVSIRSVELTRSYFAAASDPEFLHKFTYLADLLGTFSPPHDPNETLFRMVQACLETADSDPANLVAVGVYFELWLLRLSGYLPDWSRCGDCRRLLGEDEPTIVRTDQRLICETCRGNRFAALENVQNRRIAAAALSLSPTDFAASASGNERSLGQLSKILKRIISQAIGRDVVGERLGMSLNTT